MNKQEILETLFKGKEGCQKYDALTQQIANEQQKVYELDCKINSETMKPKIIGGAIVGFVIAIATGGKDWGLGVIFAGAIAGVVFHFVKKSGMKTNREEAVKQADQNIQAINEQINIVANDYREVLSIVPDEYWFTQAMEQLIKYFQADRADDIKEALHLLDEQIHRWKLEDQNNEMLVAQQRHEEYLRSIEANSKSAARGAWAGVATSIYYNSRD